MNFELVRYTEESHRELLDAWFGARKFPTLDARFLPKVGAVIFAENSRPICAGFLFQTDANTACIAHLVSDPGVEGPVRHEALDFLIMSLALVAGEEGFELLTCSANIPKVQKRFERLGFEKTDENVAHFRRELCR